MKQEERWMAKYYDVMDFIETKHCNPSRYDDAERGRYCNWLRHNRKLYNSGDLKEERAARFRELLELCERRYRRKNQYE